MPGQGRGVDREHHAHGGLVDGYARQRARVFGVGDRVADVHLVEPGELDDVSRPGLGDLHALQPFERVEVGDPGAIDGAVFPHEPDVLLRLQAPVDDASDGQPPDEVGVVEVENEHLKRRRRVVVRRRDGADDLFEKQFHAVVLAVGCPPADAVPRDGVQHGEVELVLVGVEVDEELVDLVQHLPRARVLAGRSC